MCVGEETSSARCTPSRDSRASAASTSCCVLSDSVSAMTVRRSSASSASRSTPRKASKERRDGSRSKSSEISASASAEPLAVCEAPEPQMKACSSCRACQARSAACGSRPSRCAASSPHTTSSQRGALQWKPCTTMPVLGAAVTEARAEMARSSIAPEKQAPIHAVTTQSGRTTSVVVNPRASTLALNLSQSSAYFQLRVQSTPAFTAQPSLWARKADGSPPVKK